eukprot:CAMPEP_0194542084 /NCGR_PEP_ID=MMETSP0253-20130528/83382_1 /TAXON_ID=2966 /ORGANISM="Noctiluca scintillans" /LENGTH=293 /DNA_ID=CAMNT_0039388659 /DNA_START=58 /DNA_END=937 /DNA_ORIENTATION=+
MRIGDPRKRRILPRQLWHLALADLLSVCGAIFIDLFDEVNLISEEWIVVPNVINSVGFWASMLIELHVAAGFGAIYWRSRRFMRFLNHSVWLPWAFAVVEITVVILVVSVAGSGHRERRKHQVDVCEAYMLCLIVVSTFVLYLSAVFRGSCYPGLASRRAHCMVTWYFIVTLTVTSPLAYQLLLKSLRDWKWNGVCTSLNGLANVLLYSYQPNLAATAPLQDSRALENIASTPSRSFEQWAGRPSLPVGFLVLGHEVIPVENVQRFALRESEEQTAEIEASRGVQEEAVESFE